MNSQPQNVREHDHVNWSTAIISAAVILFLLWFLTSGVSQLTVAVLLIAAGAALVLLRPDVAVIATLIYLLFLGDIRRLVSRQAGLAAQDPLLVVGPVVIGMLFGRLLFERQIKLDSPVAKLVAFLLAFMALEIVNPLQGGIAVGVAGALYYIVPLLWFWVGRSLPSERIARTLIYVVFPIVVGLAAVLGIYQNYYGFLGFEGQWVREQIANGFAAMVIDGSVIRAFSFFTSPAEYALFLGIGLVCCAAPLVVGRLRWVSLLIPLIVWAMVLASVRSAIVLSIVGLLAIGSLMGRNVEQMFARGFLAVILGGGVMYFGLHKLQGLDSLSGRTQTLLDHTADGLLKPGESSATGHWTIALNGIEKGLKNPGGEGLGATTMAASKFGSHGSAGFENDVANMFASLGMFGGLLYVSLIAVVLYTTFTLWQERRSFVALVTLGILISQFTYWLEGGHYSLVAICWFLIGSLDRSREKVPAPDPQPVMTRRVRAHTAYQP